MANTQGQQYEGWGRESQSDAFHKYVLGMKQPHRKRRPASKAQREAAGRGGKTTAARRRERQQKG